jgi:hypothetical protein
MNFASGLRVENSEDKRGGRAIRLASMALLWPSARLMHAQQVLVMPPPHKSACGAGLKRYMERKFFS